MQLSGLKTFGFGPGAYEGLKANALHEHQALQVRGQPLEVPIWITWTVKKVSTAYFLSREERNDLGSCGRRHVLHTHVYIYIYVSICVYIYNQLHMSKLLFGFPAEDDKDHPPQSLAAMSCYSSGMAQGLWCIDCVAAV